MRFSDAHIHLAEISRFVVEKEGDIFLPVCASAHFPDNFAKMQSIASENEKRGKIILTFGIHPQIFALHNELEEKIDNPDSFELYESLERFADEGRIVAIGECGFDLFDKALCGTVEAQKKAWNLQIELALRKKLPIVVHCRKALHLVFADCKRIKRIPAVVFHSWPGSSVEAKSILKRGVNAYFAIGKQVLNGNKRALDSAKNIEDGRILCETDAPYQKLKGEAETENVQIRAVHEKISAIRGVELEDFAEKVIKNFKNAFGI